MGYSTRFDGELKFTADPSAKALAKLNQMFGEDCRDHPEWNAHDLYYVDLELTEDFSGLKWNGAEKTYDLDKLVNVVIREMRKDFPDFGLSGSLLAQGEEAEDRWALVIGEDGWASKQTIATTGQRVKCPNCEHKFLLEAPRS
jgi:hypothetical protein